MKDYLESLVVEQVNRALALKRLIEYPLKFPELSGLADRCTIILDSRIQLLRELQQDIRPRMEDDLRDIFRDMRSITRDISWVEYYGIPPLYYQTPEIGFLNKVMFKIHREIKLPLTPPSVCCIATEYYSLNLFTSVIFAPLTESEFLLHLSDLYHELGHYVLDNRESELRLKAVKENYNLCFSKITDYYSNLLKDLRRDLGPPEIPAIIERIHANWKSWIIEFFCDLFALYTVGPAYAWAHLHLTVKRSDDIHELSVFSLQTHPSDESRMRMLLCGLNHLGLSEDATEIQKRWFEVKKFWGPPEVEYQYAFPQELLDEMARLTLEGLKASGISIVSEKELSTSKDNEFRIMLNEAWKVFWAIKPDEFRDWEEKAMKTLRADLK
jgi:hypothetical protein